MAATCRQVLAVRLVFVRPPFDARSSIASIYPLPLEIFPCCNGNIAHKRRNLASPRRYNRRGAARPACRCDRRPRFCPAVPAMAQLTILEFPDPRLRTRAAPVNPAWLAESASQQLIDDMFETM